MGKPVFEINHCYKKDIKSQFAFVEDDATGETLNFGTGLVTKHGFMIL